MPVTLHLVRHAQGVHNLSVANQQLHDPDLTPLGREQCADLRGRLPFPLERATYLVASPLRRTLYTALVTFKPELEGMPQEPNGGVERGRKVIALPELQEISRLPCDVGSDPAKLQAEFGPAGEVDLSLCVDGWNDKADGSPWAPVIQKLEERARKARVWLRELGEKAQAEKGEEEINIVAVTHGGFLHFLTQDWDGIDPDRGTGWGNTELRSYHFADPTGQDPEASIKETGPSWRKRRGSEIGLTEAEQRQLRVVAQVQLQAEFDEIEAESQNGKAS